MLLLPTCGISIAFAIRSVDPSGAFRGWCAVRTLQIVHFKQVLNASKLWDYQSYACIIYQRLHAERSSENIRKFT